MSGFSVYLGEEADWSYIQSMIHLGYDTLFTSLQIPEESDEVKLQYFKELLHQLQDAPVTLIIDANPSLLNHTFYQLLSFYSNGNVVIRIDHSTSIDVINQLTHAGLSCCLNASTLTEALLTQLKQQVTYFHKIVYCHNYYPRPDTGLSHSFVQAQNALIRHFNPEAIIYGFISGTKRRGPLYKGLPTLEDTRDAHPVYSAQMLIDTGVNHVIVGDIQLQRKYAQQLIQAVAERHFTLRCKVASTDSQVQALLQMTHQVRMDTPEAVIRSHNARQCIEQSIPPTQTTTRTRGMITVDNERNGRYQGELQLIKQPLPAHPNVNCIGEMIEEDIALLDCLSGNDTFSFELNT